MRRTLLVLTAALALAGCTGGDNEKRGREVLEKIKESMPDVEAKALAQKVTPEDVKQVQQALLTTKEYLGEPNGKLDSVTVNSIEAFQRAHGLKADGLLNDKTRQLLRDVQHGSSK